MRKSLISLLALTALTLAVSATPARASLILAGTFGGVSFCAADNNTVCSFGTQLQDIDGTPGTLSLGNLIIGGLSVNGSIQTQTLAPPENILNTSSLSIINNTGGTIAGSLSIGATNYIGPVTQANASGSGVWQNANGSSITLTYYDSPANVQGATTATSRPGNLLFSFSDIANGSADSFATGALATTVNDPALFSMTLGVDFNLTGGGQLLNRGQTEIKPLSAEVPEPASLLLLGSGLTGLGLKFRKRKAARSTPSDAPAWYTQS